MVEAGLASTVMGIVVDGVLRSVDVTADGKQQIVNFHHRGSFFGHPFMSVARYGVEAATSAVLCCFDRRDFERQIGVDPKLGRAFLLAVLRDLADVQEHARTMGSPRASERIARFILASCDGSRTDQPIARLPVSRRDMAAFLATTPETISRFVQEMVRHRIIRIRNSRTLQIVDVPGIERLAGQTIVDTRSSLPASVADDAFNSACIDQRQCRSFSSPVEKLGRLQPSAVDACE